MNDAHNNHNQKPNLFLKFETTQIFEYPPCGDFKSCIFLFSSRHYSPVPIQSYHTVVKQIMYYLVCLTF